MSNPSDPIPVTRELLRDWGLPDAGDSKNSRGRVVVVGGSGLSPGAVRLAGEAALRVGAGKVGAAVSPEIADVIRMSFPEAGVFELGPRGRKAESTLAAELIAADAVLIGPGFDDPRETLARLRTIAACDVACLVVDAFAVAAITNVRRATLPDILIVNANLDEASILLGREPEDIPADVAEIARTHRAIVNCYGVVASPDGDVWEVRGGGPGLGTAGSGDVLAGAITGFAARGLTPVRAAAWGAWTHARAGDRLTERLGLGFLARELAGELAQAVREV
ncbi:ADP/ATP-dependent (S)-NAD(P)H-hydrate dehydratase [uncultured Microbacterium sp.]|uniref:ADP-dependent (S)-NAD(P)H-hydrate dehydratase n=1 Tax=uncultured Microbacterium sp. TaxID=191216 RepID=A0A1Y5P0C0_9MICO|nr:ADP/ATP-dependent (S)-NAD(P)H-hydrate dehydratase [uncultured Microbacterium sp.]SBS72112.1 ADP-dependent (S)-NAD(P)H-hydrate dehydratase [uncultured Microbacterium sp.]